MDEARLCGSSLPTGPIALPALGRSRPGPKNPTWLWWDSNPRPSDPQSDALTTALRGPVPLWILSDLSSRHSIFPKQLTCHEWLSPPSPIETLSGFSQIKTNNNNKSIFKLQHLVPRDYTKHTHTHTQAPVHTSILTIQSSKRLGDLEWIKTHVFIHLTYLIRSNLKTFFLHKTIALLWLTCPPCLTETLFEFYQI